LSRRKIAAGPGASSLILIAVVLALSVLTVLTMISARNDEALSLRSEETQEEVYALFARGERSLAALDAVLVKAGKDAGDMEDYLEEVQENLPQGMTLREDQVFWTEKTDNRALGCGVRLLPPGGAERTRWTLHRLGAGDLWTEEEEPEAAETGEVPEAEDEDGEDDELDLDLEG
jgi:hypothetical protein